MDRLENNGRAESAGGPDLNPNALLDRESSGLPRAVTVASDMRTEFLGDLVAGLVLIMSAVLLTTGFLPPCVDLLFSGCVLLREASVHVVHGATRLRLQV